MALRLLVTLLLGACAAPSPPPPATPPSAEIPAAPPELAPVQDAGGADAASDAEAETAPVVRASFALRVDLPPCKFLFHAGVGSQSEVGRYLMAVSRIEVEASESCTAHVVFDESTEAKSDPDSYQGSSPTGRISSIFVGSFPFMGR